MICVTIFQLRISVIPVGLLPDGGFGALDRRFRGLVLDHDLDDLVIAEPRAPQRFR